MVTVVLQLGYTAYTGRTVAPHAFGAYALALTTVQFLGYFANAGLSTCLLRAEQLTGPTVRAASWLGAMSGVACFALVELLAPVCGGLWSMPGLTPMLQVLGFQFLVQPGMSVAVAALRRIGRARAGVAAELVGQAAGMGTGAALLANGWGALGLAAAQPVAAAVTLIAATIALTSQPLAPGPPVRARDLLASTSFLTGYSLVEFLVNSTPLWVMGRLLGPAAVGAASRASLFTGLPVTFLAQGLSRTATPVLAERRGRGVPINRATEHAVCAASAAAFICFGAVAGIGPIALSVLLGPRWEAAAALVPVLTVGAASGLLCSSGSSIDQARGAPRALVGTQSAVVATTVCSLAAAAMTRSLALMALAAAAGQAVGHAVQLRRWHRIGLLPARVSLRIHLVHLAVGCALGGAAVLGSRTAGTPAVGLVCGLVSMVPVIAACLLLRTRLPLYAAAVDAGLLRPGKDRTGVDTGAKREPAVDPDGLEPHAAASPAP